MRAGSRLAPEEIQRRPQGRRRLRQHLGDSVMDLPLSGDRTWRVDEFDSGKALSHAARQAKQRKYNEFPIIDVDSHHYELESFNEILEYMPDPVMKQLAKMANSGNSKGV